MPATKAQLDRVLTKFIAYQKLGKGRARTEQETIEHEKELARVAKAQAKQRTEG